MSINCIHPECRNYFECIQEVDEQDECPVCFEPLAYGCHKNCPAKFLSQAAEAADKS